VWTHACSVDAQTERRTRSPRQGKLVADDYHAALAIEHGRELVTVDSDFARFAGLRYRHPLARERA
jgi:predicted nucleic acid-binding protein